VKAPPDRPRSNVTPFRDAKYQQRMLASLANGFHRIEVEPEVFTLTDWREPHRAVRKMVGAKGRELVRELYEAYDRFNRDFFRGSLGEPLILATETSAPRALGDHCAEDAHGLVSVIRIAPRALACGLRFAEDVLIHEMIHTWQSEIIEDREEGYRGHGPQFAGVCNAIGAKLELPAVSPKGRHGKSDCAQWPINVRPSGYYGIGPGELARLRISTKRVRAPKASPSPSPSASAAGDVLEHDVDRTIVEPPNVLRIVQRRSIAQDVCSRLAEALHQEGERDAASALRRAAEILVYRGRDEAVGRKPRVET
jgi:SprT-like family